MCAFQRERRRCTRIMALFPSRVGIRSTANTWSEIQSVINHEGGELHDVSVYGEI